MTHSELVERVAVAIFEHWQFQEYRITATVEWVKGGNSFKQDEARAYARAALAAVYEAIKEPTPEMVEAMREAWRNTRVSGTSGMTIDAQMKADYAKEYASGLAMLAASPLNPEAGE